MAISKIRIHPAIGIARVGNSPDSVFIGPEKPREPVKPDGGFKDDQGRIKRQGARFRVYAYHDDGTPPRELGADEAEITWTVHLANKKAVHVNDGTSRANLTIDGGARSVGAGESARFDDGSITFPDADPVTVPLGEIRGQDDGRLVVLGGHGTSGSPTNSTIEYVHNEGWYDDVSDGPVSAKVHVKATGQTFSPNEVKGAWVIVAPPKFGADLGNVIDLYDRLYDRAAVQGMLKPRDAGSIWSEPPSTPSYTHDIYPILKRARENDWVAPIPDPHIHAWSEPVTDYTMRRHVFDRIKSPWSGNNDGPMEPSAHQDMPRLKNARLTNVQYGVMQKWHEGNFTNDWNGPPQPPSEITPEGLDLAALQQCVGAAFWPGIEVGGQFDRPILNTDNYAEPMRLDHGAVSPGDITQFLAVPWQGDFYLCNGKRMNGTTWWPVPRPNFVFRGDSSQKQPWLGDRVTSIREMVDNWHELGFVVREGDGFVERERGGDGAAPSS